MNNLSLTRDNILETFASYGCPPADQLIGGEYERAIVRPNGMPISYDEPFGIRWFLTQFAKRWDWTPKLEGQHIIALHKDGASITLEPGGQFELSGRAHATLIDLQQEFALNREQVTQLAKEAGFRVITCGLTPIAKVENIPWMPKGRYEIMREYLSKRGDRALFMMKGTTSVQCNYDFQNEEDCAAKVKVCSLAAPLTTAIFANSPLYQNRPTGYISYRGHIWTRTDPARTGFPPGLRNDFTYERWVDYLLQVPMMFIHKNAQWIPANGVSFRSFMENGIDGQFPNWEDWELHMTSVFPEVRIKRTIEVRGADCVSQELAIAFCAMFTGLLYDDQALHEATDLVESFAREGDRQTRFHLACKHGLQGILNSKKMLVWAERLVDIAYAGLGRYQPNAQHLLTPLVDQVSTGESPGHTLLRAWQKHPNPEMVINAVEY